MTSNIKKLFFGEFLSQTVAVYTLYAIMFTERGGLSAGQVGMLFGAFALTTLLCEVPTGILADKFPRKYSLIVSKLLLSAGMLVWLLFPSLPGYLVGIVLMGVSDSISSGAMQAYLYEDLGENSKQFTSYNTRLWATMMTAFLVGSGLASIVGPNYPILLVLSIISPAIGAGVFMTLKKDTIEPGSSHTELLGSAFKFIISKRSILIASLFLIALKSMVDLLIEYIPLYYRDSGVSIRYVPVLFFVGNLITIGLFWYGTQISSFLKRAEIRWLLVLTVGFIGSRYLGMVASVLGIFWFVRFTRVLFVHEEGEIQHLYESRFRATITSINSMGSRLLMAILLPLVGIVSLKRFSSDIRTPIIIVTACFIVVLIILKVLQRKTLKEHKIHG